jgi:hypothetical protein
MQARTRRWILFILFSGLQLVCALRYAAGVDATSQSAIAAKVTLAHDNLPAGFKVERYAGLWERNPFILPTLAVPEIRPSAFDKMFLTSWLKDGGQDVIFVQNSDTGDVQRITAQPNQNKLRIIEFHSNANPKLAEAVISDGLEQGIMKFRFDAQAGAAQMVSPEVQARSGSTPASIQNAYQAFSRPPLNGSSSQAATVADQQKLDTANQPPGGRPGAGPPGNRSPIFPKKVARGRENEGTRLPNP